MCGIAGVHGWTDEETLDQMMNALTHRGPDQEGTLLNEDAGVMMGARRLSIVDIAGGDQPISNEDGTVTVVFNGEIYNHEELRADLEASGHRFSTDVDTEVLVHLWEEYGSSFPERLDGMFAFALWDREQECVFLARDRLGIKPLYVANTDDRFIWASEIPALLEAGVDRTLDERAVYNYFSVRYTPWPDTLFEQIQKVRPGSSLLVSEDSVEEQSFWQLTPIEIPDSRNAIVDRVRSHLENAVHRRLMADVPVGAFLSGGLDSSAIVGLLSEFTDEPVETFSVGFQGDQYDESDEARFVAEHFGTNHHQKTVDLDSMDLFGDLVSHFGEPLADAAALPTMAISRKASTQVKAVLTGEGADELFAGYDQFKSIPRHRSQFGWLPNPVFTAASRAAHHSPIGSKYLRYFGSLQSDEQAILEWIRGYGTLPEAYTRLDQTPETSGLRECVDGQNEDTNSDSLQNLSRYYIRYWLPDDMLYKVDATTMAASLEARVPFLDHRLVEFAYSIPQSTKLSGGDYKPILNEAVSDVVPDRIRRRDKHGFRVPTARWFRNGHDAIERWLTEDNLETTPYVDADRVFDLWSEHRQERRDHQGALWKTLNFVAWYDTFCRY